MSIKEENDIKEEIDSDIKYENGYEDGKFWKKNNTFSYIFFVIKILLSSFLPNWISPHS